MHDKKEKLDDFKKSNRYDCGSKEVGKGLMKKFKDYCEKKDYDYILLISRAIFISAVGIGIGGCVSKVNKEIGIKKDVVKAVAEKKALMPQSTKDSLILSVDKKIVSQIDSLLHNPKNIADKGAEYIFKEASFNILYDFIKNSGVNRNFLGKPSYKPATLREKGVEHVASNLANHDVIKDRIEELKYTLVKTVASGTVSGGAVFVGGSMGFSGSRSISLKAFDEKAYENLKQSIKEREAKASKTISWENAVKISQANNSR